MSAGDDVRKVIDASPPEAMHGNVAAALRIIAERLDRADSDDESARDAVASITDLLGMLDARLEAVEERLGMYTQRR